jgi:hypothetical protein
MARPRHAADHRRAEPVLRVRAVLGNQWYGRFYDALQNKDAVVFWREVGVFGWIAFFNIAVQVLKFYVTQLLQLRWRSWMTRNYLTRWMADRTFYHLELARYASKDGQAPDNPDQRIQEDMQLFTDYTMTLSMGLLNAVVTLVSFVGILWALSGNFSFSDGRHHLPGRGRHGVAGGGVLRGRHGHHALHRPPADRHQLHASSATKPTSATTWCGCANTARPSRWTRARRWSAASSTCASAACCATTCS